MGEDLSNQNACVWIRRGGGTSVRGNEGSDTIVIQRQNRYIICIQFLK